MFLTKSAWAVSFTALAVSALACSQSDSTTTERVGGAPRTSAGGSGAGAPTGGSLAGGGLMMAQAGDNAAGGPQTRGGSMASGGLAAQAGVSTGGELTTQGGSVASGGVMALGGSAASGGVMALGGSTASGGASSVAGSSSVAGATQTTGLVRSPVPYNETPVVNDGDYAAFITGTNDFGFDLFRQIAPNQNNCMVSPISAAFALAMTFAGARNNTATQMQMVLHDTLSESAYHAAFNRLTHELKSRNIAPHTTSDGVKSVTLTPANAIWLQGGYAIAPTYLATLSTNYDSGVQLLDFASNPTGARATINQWAGEHTAGKISSLLPDGAVDGNTRMVMTSLLYFYGSWASPFVANSTFIGTGTFNGIFHTRAGTTVSVPMMHDTRNMYYAAGADYQLAELPYDGGKVRMTFLLPAEGAFESVRSNLSDRWLTQARSTIAFVDTIVTLPKFRFTWGSYSFKASLQALGMTEPFALSTADFSGIEPSRQLFIGDMHQKTIVGIDEAGTEAAAVTAVVLTGASASPPVFNVNRPFFFFIRDASGAILYAGQVVDPTLS